MEANYIPGKYYPGKGYYHECAFPACSDKYFFGRKNKKYHAECKKRIDAERLSARLEKTKEENKIMVNNLNILEELYLKSLGKNEIPIMEFKIRGYDFQASSRRIKTQKYGYECYLVYNYAYRYIEKNKTLVIYTKDELHNL